MERPLIADQVEDIQRAFPGARALISYVCRMNREPILSPARSIANLEFHHTGDEVNEVGRRIVRALEGEGIRALNPSMGFPMEMDGFPGEKIWVVGHKPVAEAAGLGVMGIHRNVIHPKFGNFILLGTIIVGTEIDAYDHPIDFNPCLECKLCVAACPTGAIGSDDHFDFSACYTHNYREFMGGFDDWVEQVTDSRDAHDYRERVSLPETVSMWQSLSFGANYKAAYCLGVCPAGEDVIAPFLEDRGGYVEEVVRPLQAKEETIYVVPGSDAEQYVEKRFPHKTVRTVGNGLRPQSIAGFLRGLPLVFQRGAAKDVTATYHFTFTGAEPISATVVIKDARVDVATGLEGEADVRVTADSATWLKFLAKERSLFRALLTRKIRVRGRLPLMRTFARCFPVA
jgi:ferredoxin